MSRLDKFPRDLIGLMLAAAEGLADTGDLARLERALMLDDEAARLFLCICQLEADLRLHESADISTRQVVQTVMGVRPAVMGVRPDASDGTWPESASTDYGSAVDRLLFSEPSPSAAPVVDSQQSTSFRSLLAALCAIVLTGLVEVWRTTLKMLWRPTPLSVTVAAFILVGLPIISGSRMISPAQSAPAVDSNGPRRFTQKTDFPQVAAVRIGDAYVSAIKIARPLAYWRFEQLQNSTVPNEMSDRWAMRLCGEARLTGPTGHRRLVFPAGEADSWLQVDEPITGLRGDYSIELWFQPDADIHASLIALISPNRSSDDPSLLHSGLIEMMGVQHEYFPSSVFRFLHRNPPSVAGGIDIFSAYPYRLHSWHHIVAVKRGAELCLYVNGMLSAAASCDSSLTTDPLIILGRLHSIPGPDSRRQLVGEMDEVAIYGRALNSEEVMEHIECGRKREEDQRSESASSFSTEYTMPNLKGAT